MGEIRQYFLQIVAVCMIAAVSNSIVKNQLMAKVLRLVSGILILLVVIAPLAEVDISAFAKSLDKELQVELDEDQFHKEFQLQVQRATREHVERIANEMGFEIRAEVTVSDDEVPVPIAIRLFGSVTTEQMLELSQYIDKQLGIPIAEQTWRRDND